MTDKPISAQSEGVAGVTVPNYGGNAIRDDVKPSPEATAVPPSANQRQVGGSHYTSKHSAQHWDLVYLLDMDYFTGQITRYLSRAHKKNGWEDYLKALHYMDKRAELGLPPFVVKDEYTLAGSDIHSAKHDPWRHPSRANTHTLLWDFCKAQEMPLHAVAAFFSYLNGRPGQARAAAVTLATSCDLEA